MRRLHALVTGLPPESSTWRRAWTQQDELVATSIEITDAWGRQLVAAICAVNGRKVSLPPPVRIDHPDRPKASDEKEVEEKKTGGIADIAEFFSKKVH